MTDEEIMKAIQTIEYSKATHVSWIRYLTKYPNNLRVLEEVKVAGGLEHHKACVAGYDQVLEVLKKARIMQTVIDGLREAINVSHTKKKLNTTISD